MKQTEYVNPFIHTNKIDVFLHNKTKTVLNIEQLLNGETIIYKPEIMNIKTPYIVDTGKKCSVFTDTELNSIYINLSEISFKLLFYIFRILQNNEDIVKINTKKFMELSGIKSRSTIYKGIDELCRYGFISPFPKQGYYWINPFMFFKGNRTEKYKSNLNVINFS